MGRRICRPCSSRQGRADRSARPAPQHLGGAATHGQIIDVLAAHQPFVINDDRGAVRNAGLLVQHVEGAADRVVGVSQHGVRDLFRENLAVMEPCVVAVKRIGAHAYHVDRKTLELSKQGLEALDFGRADPGEVERVPVQNMPAVGEVLA